MAKALPLSFYDRATLDVARELVGMVLVHRSDEGVAADEEVWAAAAWSCVWVTPCVVRWSRKPQR